MESLTRLVTDSLARHGFDRPIDPCRLQWSRWFRCDSPHSLLVVPSKPGIFAIAEEIAGNVARAPSPATSSAADTSSSVPMGGAALPHCDSPPPMDAALAASIGGGESQCGSAAPPIGTLLEVSAADEVAGEGARATFPAISSAMAKMPGLLGTTRRL